VPFQSSKWMQQSGKTCCNRLDEFFDEFVQFLIGRGLLT